MGLLTVQTFNNMALVPAVQAADAAGDTFANQGLTFLLVHNASAAPITVTVASQQQCSQGHTHNLNVSVAAGVDTWIGPFDVNRFSNSSGIVSVSYSAVASLSVGAIRVAG